MTREDTKRRAVYGMAWGSWGAAIAGSVLRVADRIPESLSLLIILFIGIGIYASLVVSRYRLSKTISDVFVAGLQLATRERRCPHCGELVPPEQVVRQHLKDSLPS